MENKRPEKIWRQKDKPDTDIIEKLKTNNNIDPILAELMAIRGIKNSEEAGQFLKPDLKHLHDPFDMKNMDKAVERINKAIVSGEKILIYGDYDVDGITAVASVYNYFSAFYQNMEYYIPNRFNEGYGISNHGIESAYKKGIDLIIALDCGIKALEQTHYLNDKKIDLIICDHHNPGDTVPDACAILNPKQKDCPYPYKELSGCGVGYKLIQAYSKNYEKEPDPDSVLDLVAMSIASDIVPITGENRTLAYFGLQKINEDPQPGIKTLLKINKYDNKELTINELVFIIGPRLNASGRIGSAEDSVKLLTCKDENELDRLAEKVNQNNKTRKDTDKKITYAALDMLKKDAELQNKKTTVLYDPGWSKGVIGIVASRLIEQYYRPTIIMTSSGNEIVGSARTVPGFNLYQSIEKCSHLLEKFGGHEFAAGLTLKTENLDAFIVCFEETVSNSISQEALTPVIEYDTELSFEKITKDFILLLKRLSPHGPGNMKPLFVSRNVEVDIQKLKIIGQDKKHLKLKLSQNGKQQFDAIAFGFAEMFDDIKNSKKIDICYNLDENTWNEQTSIQLYVKDIKTVKS